MGTDFDFYEGDCIDEVEDVDEEVSNYAFTGMSYPCIIFKDDFSCPKHKLTVISNMVKSGNMSDKDISLYFHNNGELFKLGSLSGVQLGAFIDLVGVDSIDGYLEGGVKLEGDRVYTLCTVLC